MRIVNPNGPAGRMGNAPISRPDWFAEWLANQGKWVRLQCGCIEDVHIPQCLTLLTGKRIYILCPSDHGFQAIKETIKFRDVLKAHGISINENADTDGMLPPF